MTTALAEKVTTPNAQAMAQRLQEQTEVRLVLKNYIDEHMIVEVDYGKIPGTDKPTLLQPGAEKLAEMFNCTPEYTVTQRIEDWATGLFHYEFSCKIVHRQSDKVISEGMGSCNTRESRYRWRTAKRVCPHCKKDCINKSKFPPKNDPSAEPGYYCYAKVGGCGAEFTAKDPAIINQEQGRVENDDVASMVNTVLKMAKKRALVDASICLARRYGFQFHQDLEDMGPDDIQTPAPKSPTPGPAPKPNGTAPKAATPPSPPADAGDAWEPNDAPINVETIDGVCAWIARLGRIWDAKFKKKTEGVIGRPLGVNEEVKHLKQIEGERIIEALKAAVAEKEAAAKAPQPATA